MYRLLAFSLFAIAVTAVARGSDVDYRTQIKPILAEKCYSCHGVLEQESSLRVETRALMMQGGDSGPILVPGDPDASTLLERVRSVDADRMPPHDEGSALSREQIQLISSWILSGAEAPEEDVPVGPSEHWAFQPIHDPRAKTDTESPHESSASADDSLTSLSDGAKGANPVDLILSEKQKRHRIQPQPFAERSLQLRRLYLDLIGLPPTETQLRDPRHWDVIVDELLASPHHGERWARHWMDVWRYSDWYGLGAQLRNSQKHLWRWRDWIVDSLNADKGFDRMTVEMIAGDELSPEDANVVVATGFLARNYFLFNRTTWLDNTIEHTSKAFLGLTVNCAKCHDHKYDPISQADYYRLRAIFEPHQVRLDPVPGVTNLEADGLPRVFDDDPTAKTFLHVRGDPKHPDLETEIQPGVPAIFESFAPQVEAIDLPVHAYAPGTRDYYQRARLDSQRAAVARAEREWKEAAKVQRHATSNGTGIPSSATASPATNAESENESDAKSYRSNLKTAEVKLAAARAKLVSLESTIAADNAAVASNTKPGDLANSARQALLRQADSRLADAELRVLVDAGDEKKLKAARMALKQAKEAIKTIAADGNKIDYEPLRGSRKALESPADKEADYPAIYSSQSTGRRLAFARWLVSDKNPLTARVVANHVWMRHFGTPLVDSEFDFGLRAPVPVNVELLDLLASELIRSGWSLKRLHRLIVTSDAYRRDTSTRDACSEALDHDPENRLYWRTNSRRMESQLVRDCLLSLADHLDLSLGGPALDHNHEPPRRSLYFKHSPDQREAFLEMFDNADVLACYRRSESIVPQQALALSNSRLSIESANRIAKRIGDSLDADDATSFIQAVFIAILAREASEAEATACMQFLVQLSPKGDGVWRPSERARARFVHAILNHNDFITIR